MDEEHRHPELSRRQVALFERNPVCALCYRVCMDLCEEYGGIRFDLLESIVAADELCEKIVQHSWELSGIEYYRNWVRNRLNFSHPAVACTFATVCVTLSCMDDLPAPVRQLARDFQGLIIGEGNELYDNLRSAAYRQDITLAFDTYGEPPPEPSLLHEYEQACQHVTELEKEIITLKTQLEMKNKKTSHQAPVINVAGNFIDIHDNEHCNIYATEPKTEENNVPKDTYQPPVPKENDYNAVREYIAERKKYDEDFRIYWDSHNLKQNSAYLTREFGWIVDDHSLGTNLNRHR